MWTSWYWFLRNEKRIVLKRVNSWWHWLIQGVSVLTIASYTPYFPVDLLFLIDLGWTALTVIVVGKACFVLILEWCWQTSTELYVSKLQPSFTRYWFLLLIMHSWLVICDWLSHAGLWPSSGLCPGDWVIWVMVTWIGLFFNSLSYPFSYFFSSRISHVRLSHWGCMKVLSSVNSLSPKFSCCPSGCPVGSNFTWAHPVSPAPSAPLSDKPLWAPFSKRKAVRGSRNSAN